MGATEPNLRAAARIEGELREKPMIKMPKARALKAKAAVITVGKARGFVIEHGHDRLVVTAAHCLPRNDEGQLLIPAIGGISHLKERTYEKLPPGLGI